jgi:hypothetical protein
MENIFGSVRNVNGKLKTYEAGDRPLSQPGKYAKGTRAEDGVPRRQTMVPNRTLSPDSNYTYGTDAGLPRTTPAPYMLEAPRMVNYGPHRPIWRGWRPKRPVKAYGQVGMEMPVKQRGPKFESSGVIPSEAEVRDYASNEAQTPGHPIAPYPDMIPDYFREYGIYVDGDTPNQQQKSITGNMLGNLGAEEADAGADYLKQTTGFDVVGIAKDIAGGIKSKYGNQMPSTTQTMATAPAPVKPDIPWKTLGIVAGVGVAALFVLPKVLK